MMVKNTFAQRKKERSDKLPGTIQIDVDELWVYYTSLSLPVPQNARHLVYEQGVPRLLDLFDEFGIRATFFVCGQDLPKQTAVIQEMIKRGHEVANHTYSHPSGFAKLTFAEKKDEILRSHELISAAAGIEPVGFKSPGFSFRRDQLSILEEAGYLYDSSILPTYYAPVMRWLPYLLHKQKVDSTHFGAFLHGFAPLRPYYPDKLRPYRTQKATPLETSDDITKHFWEVPVTTVPFIRTPMHSTFILSTNQRLFDIGTALVRKQAIPINYLLHGADVLDTIDDPALESYPFLQRSWDEKRPLYLHILKTLINYFELLPTRQLIEYFGTIK